MVRLHRAKSQSASPQYWAFPLNPWSQLSVRNLVRVLFNTHLFPIKSFLIACSEHRIPSKTAGQIENISHSSWGQEKKQCTCLLHRGWWFCADLLEVWPFAEQTFWFCFSLHQCLWNNNWSHLCSVGWNSIMAFIQQPQWLDCSCAPHSCTVHFRSKVSSQLCQDSYCEAVLAQHGSLPKQSQQRLTFKNKGFYFFVLFRICMLCHDLWKSYGTKKAGINYCIPNPLWNVLKTVSATEFGKYNQPLVPDCCRRVSAFYTPNILILQLFPTAHTVLISIASPFFSLSTEGVHYK